MGYQRGDNRWGGGEERWQGNRYEQEGGSFGNWRSGRDRGDWDRNRERGFGGGYDRDRDRDDDRGFFERAGETVRSWFNDEDDDRGRSYRGDDRYRSEQRYGGGRMGDRNYRPTSASAFGNRSDDRYSGGGFSGGFESDVNRPADTWGGSGFGGYDDNGRRFDRIDAGSTGTQGAHPMSSPVGGGYDNPGYGFGGGHYGSSARSAAIMRQSGRGRGGSSQSPHDRQYSEWRQRQIDDLDRDYDEYSREHQSKFDQEFGGWRSKRQTQRQHMGRVSEHMEVIGSDGQHIGTVDAVKGDRIILTKSDESAGGRHHSIPCSWIENVDDKVTVNKSSEEAKRAWKDEENSRALFERQDQGSEGPHMLNRSFSGTYDDNR